MPAWRVIKPMLRIVGSLFAIYMIVVVLIYFRQRSMLFYPSHAALSTGLTPWTDGNRTIGCCREAPKARTIWLMMHGNAGQAADRDYVLRRMSGQDSLYVLEYPGYGFREGRPSLESLNRAALEAYRLPIAASGHSGLCLGGVHWQRPCLRAGPGENCAR